MSESDHSDDVEIDDPNATDPADDPVISDVAQSIEEAKEASQDVDQG